MENLVFKYDENTGAINSCTLYGKELLDTSLPSKEFMVNGRSLPLRMYKRNGAEGSIVMKGERYIDHYTGWGLVLTRAMGGRSNLKHNCYGINYWIRREIADITCIDPGPGGPVVEAPLYVDTFSLLNLNWKFWGEDTRMLFSAVHSQGPSYEFGHCGFENDTPANSKKYMQNIWRRIYPGVMATHGGVFYNAKTEEWLAITCRRSNVGYILNIEDAGEGVSYDFTLHSEFKMNDRLRLPEIKIYYGKTKQEMMEWLADYTREFYHEPPEWVWKGTWKEGIAWNNLKSWREMGEKFISEVKDGVCTGLRCNLVTDRPLRSGTLPKSYDPDANYGTKEEFKQMCHNLKKNNVPFMVWMSHSGLMPGTYGVDDDWFIRGTDGRINASWGSEDAGMYSINPGHPGYIEYTKKWIKFYIEECGASGIFFDCLGWAFPSDFAKRDFMRYPGDTNVMAIKFADEIYSYIKSLNSEAIMMGEGCSLDMPIDVFSMANNIAREGNDMGPRDFMLYLNQFSEKQMMIDQAPCYMPAAGMCNINDEPEYLEHNRYMGAYMKEHGGPGSFKLLKDGVSVRDDMLFIADMGKEISVELADVKKLTEVVTGAEVLPENGVFNAGFGFYKMN